MKYLHDWTSALSYIYDWEPTKRSQIANCDPFFMFSIFEDLKQNFFRSGISTIHAKKMIRKSRACYIKQRYNNEYFGYVILMTKLLKFLCVLHANMSFHLLKFLRSGYLQLIRFLDDFLQFH